ncbi:hypothetical protein [Streptomyces sp. NRRL F-5635]|uniref:hypothetical protein n=1 Tax=Streptomyces sp. NRRL F-5635 TaxID=1463865 RepID=UPI0004CD95B2|nr:hypothetical protein [Streptomyces sp. NRRL F-5635]
MSDRLNQTPGHRMAGEPPARTRPQGRPRPPLASLQAAAGNRAVATAIRRGAGTAIQRAGGTAQLPPGAVVARATAAPVDDLQITPVTETERPARESGGGADTAAEQQAAVDEVAAQKAKVTEASLGRAAAETEVWNASGEAVEAHKKAAEARGRAHRLTTEAEAAERDGEKSRADADLHTGAARRKTGEQRAAEARASGFRGTERGKRQEAEKARDDERMYTERAEKAEKERKDAEDRAARFQKLADEAREKQKAAEERVKRLQKEAKEAGEKQKAAEAEARTRAEAQDQALQKAAKAEVEAEAEAEIAERVKQWAAAAEAALRQAGAAQKDAALRKGEAGDADASKKEAEGEAAECAEVRSTAEEQAKKARELAALRDREADEAAQERGKAEREAEKHKEAADKAMEQAAQAQAAAQKHENTAQERRRQVSQARAEEQKHAQDATAAQNRAAAAGQRQQDQRAAQTTASDAMSAAKKAQEAEKKAKEEAAAEAAKKNGTEAASTDKAGQSLGKRVGGAIKKGAAKAKPWIDQPDTVALRLSSPYSGTHRAEATKLGDTGTARNTTIQQDVENPINLASDFTGAFNDVVTYKDSVGKRHEKGPASHGHRKNVNTKPLAGTTNTLMTVNDGVKISDNLIRTAKGASGVAELGDASGALTVAFSTLTAGREVRALKNTRAQRNELKEHFKGEVAQRGRKLQDVLNELGAANTALAGTSVRLAAARPGEEAEALQAVENERTRIDGLRKELLEHLAAGRDYAVEKKKRKLTHRSLALGGNVARTAAGAVAIAAATGAVSGGIVPGVMAAGTALGLGGLAAKKGVKKANKRYNSVRDYQKHARTTTPQEGTPASEKPRLDEDGRGRRSDAWKEAVMVTHAIKQGKRQLNAQEIYAQAAGPAVPASENVPDDIRRKARDFLKTLKCGPDHHNQTEPEWEASLNDPDQQTEWEEAIAKALSSL